MIFNNRKDAGEKLAEALIKYNDQKNVVVLGLARGGCVVAGAVAVKLHLPMDVVVVRKIGAPDNPELALGAIDQHGRGEFNNHLITLLGVSKDYLKREIEKEKEVVLQRKDKYLGGKDSLDLSGKTVILIDDGIATGASMKVAIDSVLSQNVKGIVLAVPVSAPESLEKLEKYVDEVICLSRPSFFQAVGAFYREFQQVSDEEIISLLTRTKEGF